MIKCKICGKMLNRVSGLHLKMHGITKEEYKLNFPGAPLISKASRRRYSEGLKKCYRENPEIILKILKSQKKYHQKNPGAHAGVNAGGYIDGRYYKRKQAQEQARIRDNHCCRKCGMTQDEHLERWGRVLEGHHVDEDEDNNDLDNILTLCCICHAKIKNLLIRVVRQMTAWSNPDKSSN